MHTGSALLTKPLKHTSLTGLVVIFSNQILISGGKKGYLPQGCWITVIIYSYNLPCSFVVQTVLLVNVQYCLLSSV